MNDYKHFYIRVRKNYPFVARELMPETCLKDWNQIPEVLDKYCSVTGSEPQWVTDNTDEHRTKFVAVVCKLADPLFFNYRYSINYKLRKTVSTAIGCTKHQISHTLRKARDFIKVYPEFKMQVNDIWAKMCR